MKRSRHLLAATPLAGLLLLAACGSSSSTSSSDTTAAGATTVAGATTTAAMTDTTAAGAATTAAAGGAVSLAGDCPATIVIQTDWQPEAEHGFLYNMFGSDAVIDAKGGKVTGTLVDSTGADTGVKLEVRSGGASVGYTPPTQLLYSDSAITMAFAYSDEGVQYSGQFPTVAIVAPFEKNPQMIMWDPATYPDVKTIADLGKQKITIRYASPAAYMDYFSSTGIVSKDQLDGKFDLAGFVADQGKTAHQGFASAEPYVLKNETKEWGKDVAFQYIADAGWNVYPEPLAVKPENVTKMAACFKKFVPLVQQSQANYVKSPATANALIVKTVAEFNNGWVYTAGTAEFGVATMLKDGLVANGPGGYIGGFDDARMSDVVAKAIPVFTAGDVKPKDGLKATDIYTNEFVDKSIKL